MERRETADGVMAKCVVLIFRIVRRHRIHANIGQPSAQIVAMTENQSVNRPIRVGVLKARRKVPPVRGSPDGEGDDGIDCQAGLFVC